MKSKILITGGSGLVGTKLSERLSQEGNEVIHLSRFKRKNSKYQVFTWDIERGLIENGAFENVKCVIHLAGEGIAEKKWTAKRKKELASSRIDGANIIYDHLKTADQQIDTFISASAIGIYGFDTGGILQTEDRIQLGDDFLATLTKKWEAVADQFQERNARAVKLRIGLVLSDQGGILGKLVPPVKLGLASAFGSGEQYMSWIHIDDLVNIFIHAIKNDEITGAYNAVSPGPVTNKEFLTELSSALNRPFFLPNTPKFVLKMALGELSSALLGGNKVSSRKIEDSGFNFQFKTLGTALNDLVKP